ncbi:MAG TPA: PQQ-dependent sugar dehydrogenase [Kiritimatiellia bacterium]|nr:PQQ-dependent sugar dehydrogenase [Kiritimatiellia bacterium]
MQITFKTVSALAVILLAGFPHHADAQVRYAAESLSIPLDPPVERYRVEDAFPQLPQLESPLSIEAPPGETNRIFFASRQGRIFVITNLAQSTSAPAFLDISERVLLDTQERALKGFAFHPQYATNGYIYVTYCHTGGTARLSRFTRSPTNELAADPDSELVLIDQQNDGVFHNINNAAFGPDGYLYVAFGDEGQPGASNPNAQVITQDFWSAILRIDPDKRPGSLPPNPHPAIAGATNYAIPPDNPFIGATQFNGQAVNPDVVRTEFFAVGFRNPWQFSIDPETGDLWVGDVGDLLRESVLILPPGGNAGWPYREGSLPGPQAPPTGFTATPLVWDYAHDSGPFGGAAVIGGVVMRTPYYPELTGAYVCIDHISGHLWSIERSPAGTNVARIAGQGGVVQLALDPANGSLLLANHNLGRIQRLVEETNLPAYPERLSETGLFSDLATLAPATGVVAYSINLPFWSDFAVKRRWFAITNLTDGFGFHRDAPWDTPPGAFWVKHFDLELDRFNTATARRVETRVLVRTTNGAYGVSYRWNAEQTEAFLVPDMGDVIDLPVTNSGTPATQRWTIPSRAECLVCHRPDAGHVLGFNTRQLNRTGSLSGVAGDFINLLSAASYFTNDADNPLLLPRHVRPTEVEYSLEARARSYLAVNCGYCHQGGGSVAGSEWDGRAHILLESCGLIRVPPVDNKGNTNNLLVAPGNETNSVVLSRMSNAYGFSRMPPLASSMLDYEGIQLVANWINQQLPGWQSYAEWRLAHFGSTNSPAGAPEADPDDDGASNWAEYLGYSNPTNAASAWSGDIALGPGGVEVVYELFNRGVVVETSSDLLVWTPWAVAANHALPMNTGQVVRLTAPPSISNAFYRFRLEPR